MNVRKLALALTLTAAVVAASLFIPGVAGRSAAHLLAQQPAATSPAAPAGGADQKPAVDSQLAHPQPPAPDITQPAPPPPAPVSLATRLSGLLGIVLIIGIGFLMSHNRRAIRWKTVAW